MNKNFVQTPDIQVTTDWCRKEELRECDTNVVVMAGLIMHDLHIARNAVGYLYYWHKGVYKPKGEKAVLEVYSKYLDALNWSTRWRGTMADNLIRYIGEHSPELLDRPDFYKINLANGVYHLNYPEDIAFQPSTPEYLTTIQLPIVYDPTAECPTWEKFLNDVFPEGTQLLLEIIGMCMIPFTKLQKCIILLGTGNNGKGMYIRGLQEIIGSSNISHIPLPKLQDKFASSGLVGKLLNVFGDLPMRAMKDTSMFKALTGEDSIQVEYKGKDSFPYKPFARYLFSTNKRVTTEDDDSIGFKRRFLEIPFARVFNTDPRIGEEIEYQLKSQKEISGVFNLVKYLIPNIIENGFTISERVAALIDNYTPVPPNILVWLKNNVVEDPNAAIPTTAFWQYYTSHCPTPDNNEGFSKVSLISYMKSTFPNCTPNLAVKHWRGEGPVKSYMGVRMTSNDIHTEVRSLAYQLRGCMDDIEGAIN